MKKNMNLFIGALFALSFFIFGWLSHTAYSPIHMIEKPSVLDKIKKEKELRVVLLNAPYTYYIGSNGAQGFEYKLIKAYADHLNVDLNITAVNSISEAIEKAKDQTFHITSAALSKATPSLKEFRFGPSYFEVHQQVICNRNMTNNKIFPRNVESLAGLNIKVEEDTSYSSTVRSLVKDGYDINVTFTSAYTTEELLEQVSSNKIDCTIADSNIYALNLRYYPEMDMAFTISQREQLAWILPKDSQKLEIDMYTWLNDFNQRGEMAELKDHYFSNIYSFNYYDNKIFYKRIKKRLPK